MKIELRMNGSLTVIMRPENDVERSVLTAMTEGAQKGRTVTMDGEADEFFVSVER